MAVEDAPILPLPIHDWMVRTQLHLLLIQLTNTISAESFP